MNDIFGEAPIKAILPVKEKFEYHTLILVLPSGESELPEVRVECKGADKEDSVCDERFCQVKELFLSVGTWDAIRSAGEIELGRLSARMDWSDPEEPWVDVEP